MNPDEKEATKPNYNLETIEKLLKEAESNGMNFETKWNYIGGHFGVSKEAVRKWYYRNRKEEKLHITSDQWRTAHFILTGSTKSNRDSIPTIKRKISYLCSNNVKK